ncbi:universal stress protein [Actinosynnema sp. NPDC050801]|uniref:universal stress protein n=1 Tax=unclassified Actinosynnema TaxID=2637065 RepID=UPI0033E0AF9B
MTARLGPAPPVVSGVSFSAASLAGARWAAHHALQRGRDLRLVHACRDLGEVDAARARLDELAARLREASPLLGVSARVVVASAGRALVAESHTADMIVVGGPAPDATSVLASTVSARSRCPVTAAPADAGSEHPDPSDRPVAVGISGDALAEPTLRAAFTLAAALNTGLRVVCCTLDDHSTTPVTIPDIAEAALSATRACAAHHPTVPVDVRMARSRPATGLARHAVLASMLVIGSSPTATDTSTSHRLLRRGAGPVVLVGPLVVPQPASDSPPPR